MKTRRALDQWKPHRTGIPIRRRQEVLHVHPLGVGPPGSAQDLRVRFLYDLSDTDVCPDIKLMAARPVLSSAGWDALPLVLCVDLVPREEESPVEKNEDAKGLAFVPALYMTTSQVDRLQKAAILGGCRGILLDTTICPVGFEHSQLRAMGWVPFMRAPMVTGVVLDGLYVYLTPMGAFLQQAEDKCRALRQLAELDTSNGPGARLSATVLAAPGVELLDQVLSALPGKNPLGFRAGNAIHGKYVLEDDGAVVLSQVWDNSSNRFHSEMILFALRLLGAGLKYADPERYMGIVKIPGNSVWYGNCTSVMETFDIISSGEEEDAVATDPSRFRTLRLMAWPPPFVYPVALEHDLFPTGDLFLMEVAAKHEKLAKRLFYLRFPPTLTGEPPRVPRAILNQ